MFVSSRSEQSEFRKRYRWMRVVVVLTFVVFVGRLVQLQIVRGPELRAESIDNVVRTVSIPAVRGRLFDDKGRLIATSMPSHTLVVTTLSPVVWHSTLTADRLGRVLTIG